MSKVYIHYNDINYVRKWENLPSGKFNGAYYYSRDIEEHLAPYLTTKRPINVIGTVCCGGVDHMVVFIHNYLNSKAYGWLSRYNDVIVVSSDYNVEDEILKNHKVIHLPLSVNVEEIAKHKVKKKTEDACYMGNQWVFKKQELAELVPPDVHRFGEMDREKLWDIVAKYKYAYAIGLCAIEARVLGCRLKMSRYRYPDPEGKFKVFDLREAAVCLQEAIDILETTGDPYVDCTKLDSYKKAIDSHPENK